MPSEIQVYELIGLKREGKVFALLTGKEQIIFIRDIVKKLKIKEISTGMVIREISIDKNNLITIEELRSSGVIFNEADLLAIFKIIDKDGDERIVLYPFHLVKNEPIREEENIDICVGRFDLAAWHPILAS